MIVLRVWLTPRPWRELAYLVAGVVTGLPTFVLALAGIVVAAASVLTVGLPLLVGVLALARLTPRYFRGPARRLLGWDWGDPPPLPGRGRWGRVRALLGDPTAWRALAYCLARWPLMVAGAHDKQVAPERVRELYADVGSKQKILIDLACSSHNAMWERNHLLLFKASLEWLEDGTVNGMTEGIVRVGY